MLNWLKAALLFALDARCPICESPVFQLALCSHCIFKPLLETTTASKRFSSAFELDSKAQKLLHEIKFQKRYPLLVHLKPWLPSHFPWPVDSYTRLVPVPLSRERFFERGFNQSEWLACRLSEKTQIPTDKAGLIKTRHTEAQSNLSRRERQTNLRHAFSWRSPDPAPKRVILIDDVLTTGATLKECEKTLLSHGTEEVYGWTFFRKTMKPNGTFDENIQEKTAHPIVPHHTDS